MRRLHFVSIIALAVALFSATASQAQAPAGFTSLFDGKTLEGWEQKNGTAAYEVVDGTIKGTTAEGSPNSFLCTTKNYDNFELHFEVKVDVGLNSGVQIRSMSKEDYKKGRVHGPQVEIESDPGESGYIYSEGTGRGWISPKRTQAKAFKNDGWNKYRVVADGPHIQTWVNGIAVEDMETPEVESLEGFIGLQVHGIGRGKGPFTVQWKNIYIREFDGTERRTLQAHQGTPEIDGKIDDVWKTAPVVSTSREVEEHNSLDLDQKVSRAKIRCLWDKDHLYCLAEVKDAEISMSAFEAWEQDSVEFFVDGNLSRSSPYDSDDAQYRVNVDNEKTCGEFNNINDFTSAVTKVEGGYIVEVAIKLDGKSGKKIGFDVQINNDPGSGRRQSTAKWNDISNDSYLDTSGLGTLEMIDGKK